jgi:thioesterase domain-containing protein
MTISAPELEALFAKEIPISKSMGIRVISMGLDEAKIEIPLKLNTNHKGTVFGGSLYAGCAFACYGIFLSSLRAEGIQTNDIVISEGTIKYLAPVDADCTITSGFENQKERQIFFQTLKNKNKARQKMRAQIHVGQKLCAEFSGQFVAILPSGK